MDHRFTVTLASSSDITAICDMLKYALPLHKPLTLERHDSEEPPHIAIVLSVTRTSMSEKKSAE